MAPLAAAVARATPALAQDPAPSPAGACAAPMGMVGVAAGQRVGVGAFHHDAIPCDFLLRIVGIDGKAIVHETLQIPGGGGAYREYALAAGLGKTQGQADRRMFHVEADLPDDHLVGASVEVFDEKTGGAAGAVTPCDEPLPPTLAMGMVGVAPGQTLRVGLFHHDAIPCDLLLRVLGTDGKALGEQKVKLAPSGGAFVDFPLGAGLAKGARLPIHVDVLHPPQHEVTASLELLDPKTGVASYLNDPCLMPLPT